MFHLNPKADGKQGQTSSRDLGGGSIPHRHGIEKPATEQRPPQSLPAAHIGPPVHCPPNKQSFPIPTYYLANGKSGECAQSPAYQPDEYITAKELGAPTFQVGSLRSNLPATR